MMLHICTNITAIEIQTNDLKNMHVCTNIASPVHYNTYTYALTCMTFIFELQHRSGKTLNFPMISSKWILMK